MAELKPRILVADDEPNIRKNLGLLLEAAGYVVDVAENGDKALQLCKENHPNIAFVDLNMPKMKGLDVLAHIRALSPKTAVVVITAYGTAANAVEAMKLGAVDFIEKPFDAKTIETLVTEILFRGRVGRAGSFDDLMHLAELARQRNAVIEERAYLKTAMVRGLDRPEPYYWLGLWWDRQGDEKRAIQHYYMAVSAQHDYQPAIDALKRLGKPVNHQ